MGHMVRLRKAQSILTVGPTRDEDPHDYSSLRPDMPHRDNANSDAPHKRLSCPSQAFLSPHYLTWTASSGVVAGPFLTLQDWQSWFCQCLTEVATSIADLHSLVAEPRGAKEIKCQQWPSRLQRKCQKSVLQCFIGHRLSRRETGFNSLNL